MKRSRGGTPYISRAADGVLGLTCDICDSAILWTICNFFFAQDCEAVLDQTMAPYDRAGWITPVQDHFAHSGEGPHDLPITERIAIMVRLAFLILFSICGLQLSLSARVTPRYLAVFTRCDVVGT
jgi:hypothetical protein